MIKEELSGRMRMIGWMDGHDMLFRGRSEDKEEDEDQSAFEEEKKKVGRHSEKHDCARKRPRAASSDQPLADDPESEAEVPPVPEGAR